MSPVAQSRCELATHFPFQTPSQNPHPQHTLNIDLNLFFSLPFGDICFPCKWHSARGAEVQLDYRLPCRSLVPAAATLMET